MSVLWKDPREVLYLSAEAAKDSREAEKRRRQRNKVQVYKSLERKRGKRSGNVTAYCCQLCIRGLYDPERKYETEDLSVHHIIPIAEDWDSRLDNDNLITLCRKHHEQAEASSIPRDELRGIAEEQEEGNDFPAIG